MVVARMSDPENIIQQKIRGPIAGVYKLSQDIDASIFFWEQMFATFGQIERFVSTSSRSLS